VNTFATAPVFASPGAHQDEMRVQQLLKEYQSSKEESKRKELVEQISKTVAHQFEEKQLIRERELKELEERVKELRTTHAKRESLKEKIIADRVQQLINNVDGMGWGYEPSNIMFPAGGMLPATSSPLLVPPGQNAHPLGYMPAQALPSQASTRATNVDLRGPAGAPLPQPASVAAFSTTAAPAALLPTEGTNPSPVEAVEPLQELRDAPAVDGIKER
jgi:hypothetical protein